MMYSNVPYPLRLCVELMHYCVISNKKTEDVKPSELRDSMKFYFTNQEIDEAVDVLAGRKVYE